MAVAARLSGCAVHDSYLAADARTRMLGLSEVPLGSCLGVPDQRASFTVNSGLASRI
jgi:hypothetical protein